MFFEYACCPRCLGDLIKLVRLSKREFACLQCRESGEVLPADEYVATKKELAAVRRPPAPAPSLSTA